MGFGDRLRAAREHAGLSQRQLASAVEAAGVELSAGQLAKLESGARTNPRAAVVAELAKASGVRVQWLLSDSGPMLEPERSEVDSFEAALAMFVAQESHEGRGADARAFLDGYDSKYAGARDKSPEWWFAQLRDEFRAWRRPPKVVGSREIAEDEPERPAKLNPRRAR